jgi:hypothetical protein
MKCTKLLLLSAVLATTQAAFPASDLQLSEQESASPCCRSCWDTCGYIDSKVNGAMSTMMAKMPGPSKDFAPMIAALEAKHAAQLAAQLAAHTTLEAKHAAQLKALEDKLAHLAFSQDAGSGACALKCKTGNLELLSSGAQ